MTGYTEKASAASMDFEYLLPRIEQSSDTASFGVDDTDESVCSIVITPKFQSNGYFVRIDRDWIEVTPALITSVCLTLL